jgi:hypothetical protein
LLCCLRQIQGWVLKYDNVFRVLIMQFIDARNFDLRAMKKSCVHIAQPDCRLIPFEAFNLLYCDGKGWSAKSDDRCTRVAGNTGRVRRGGAPLFGLFQVYLSSGRQKPRTKS